MHSFFKEKANKNFIFLLIFRMLLIKIDKKWRNY